MRPSGRSPVWQGWKIGREICDRPEFRLNFQQMYDLSKTRLESGARIGQEVRVGKRIA